MFVWQVLYQRMISTVPTGLVKCLLWGVTVTEGVMSSLAWLGGDTNIETSNKSEEESTSLRKLVYCL